MYRTPGPTVHPCLGLSGTRLLLAEKNDYDTNFSFQFRQTTLRIVVVD